MPGTKELYDQLYSDQLYTDSYQNFVNKYGSEQGQIELYNKLYSDQLYTNDLNSFKFKYFSDLKKKETGALPSEPQEASSSLASQQGVGLGPQASSITKVKDPSAYNKNIEHKDWVGIQDATRGMINAKSASEYKSFESKLNSYKAVYGDVLNNDANISDDIRAAKRNESKLFSVKAPVTKPVAEVALGIKSKAPIPTKERATQEESISGMNKRAATLGEFTPEERHDQFALTMLESGLSSETSEADKESRDYADEQVSNIKDINSLISAINNRIDFHLPTSSSRPIDTAITQAILEFKKGKKEATNEEIVERAKEILYGQRMQGITDKAVDNFLTRNTELGTDFANTLISLFEPTAANVQTGDQAQMLKSVESMKNKVKLERARFSRDLDKLESMRGEIEAVTQEDFDAMSYEDQQAYIAKYKEADLLSKNLYSKFDAWNNSEQDIQDFESEADLLKRNYGYMANSVGKLHAGALRIIGGVEKWVELATGAKGDSLGSSEALSKKLSKSLSYKDIDTPYDLMRYSGSLLADQGSNFALAATTGALSPYIIATSAAGAKYEELDKEEAKAEKELYTTGQKFLTSVIVGGLEWVTEKAEIEVWKKALPSWRLAEAAKRGATDLELKVMREELQKGLKGAINMSKAVVSGQVKEGSAEAMSQIGGNLADKYVLGKSKVGVFDGVDEAFIGGATIGGLVTIAPALAAQVITPFINDPERKIKSNVERLKQLDIALADAKESNKPTIQAAIEKVSQENIALINGGLDVMDNLTPEEIKRNVELYDNIKDVKQKYVEIKNDPNLSEEQKRSVMGPLSEQYDKFVAERLSIIKKGEANAIQKQGSGQVPVQPKTGTSEKVEQRVSETESQGATKEGVQEEIKIDRPSIALNTKADVESLKSQPAESETGQTFNLDGTVYGDGGLIVPVASENMTQDELTPERIADFVESNSTKVGDQTVKVGIYKFPNSNQVSIDLNIAVPRANRAVALEFGKASGQESLFDLDTYENIKTGADGKNPMQFTDEQFREISKALKEGRMPEFLQQTTVAQERGAQATTKTKLAANIKKAIAKVFPDLSVNEFNDSEGMKDYVAKKYGDEVAKDFKGDDAARVIYVDGKVAEILVNKKLSDETSIPHEVWHGILSKAFGENEKLFKEFRQEIEKVLTENGYTDIVDQLDEFSSNTEYIESDTQAQEWLAQLGGMLATAGINPSKLNANQKSFLQQIKDVVNKFAKVITGQPVFLDEATPENILDFMTSISDSLSRGEDISGYFKTEEKVSNTEKIFNSKAQKIGSFDIGYFEDADEFKKLENEGYVIQNSSISNISGEPVAVHQPDSLLVGNVKYNGKQIIDGNGGVYYTLKFGNVWASGKKTSASGLAKLINASRKNSSDGKGRLLLVMGSRDKIISSVQGVKASMEVLENLVFDGLIARSDFRKALTTAGKKYNIDFSGSDSSSAIKKDISDKFMNVNDSSFQRRGDFFSDLITEIGNTESASKNIKEIQKALGATKNISFSKQGIRNQIGVVLSERLTQGVPSGHYYAYIEVDDDVDIVEDKQHESYPWSIVQKNGERPVLHVLNERLKATSTITKEDGSSASNAELGLAQRGMGYGIVSGSVTTKAQKAHPYIPDNVFDKLTLDENGDVVFNHYSRVDIDRVKPSTGSGSLYTSKEEQRALASVGGLAMYYTQAGQKESFVGNIKNTVTVDPEKIYYLNQDPLNLYDEAKEQFMNHMNKFNARKVEYAFDANYQTAWITKVANEKGFDMVIGKWRNDYDFRAQTKKTLKTLPENIDFKTPTEEESKIEVGDKILLMGQETLLTGVDANGVYTYVRKNSSGSIPLERHMMSGRDPVALIAKGPHTFNEETGEIVKVETKAQKSSVERMKSELKDVIAKSKKRGANNNTVYKAALGYLQGSRAYEQMSDVDREAVVRELRAELGIKEKKAPTANRMLGAIKNVTKITVNEMAALKSQIRLEAKAAKEKATELNALRKKLSLEVADLAKAGRISTRQAAVIIKRIGSVNLDKPSMVSKFVDYMSKVFNDADYADKLRTASSNIAKIKKFHKGDNVQATVYVMAKNFLMLDPKMVDNIDEYIAMSNEVLNAVMPTSTSSGVKIRIAADIDKINKYTEKEVEGQTKKLQQELLEEYKDLVDAGVLDDSMSYDEIVEIIDSINDEAPQDILDKGEDIRQYIVKMFGSLSAIGKEIVAKGVDPVTGDIVNLTDDQKVLLKKFLNMDIDNMSIKDAKLALEYMSNFVTNKITDGMAGLVAGYVGSENVKTFKKTGAKFRSLKLFFSKKIGRLIGEEITNLNILLEQALSGQDRASLFRSLSGLNKVINGNAEARRKSTDKMTAYVKKFENVKDFFTLENNVERGVLSFLIRTNNTSDELNRRKGLIEQTIAKLMDGNEQEVALAEVIQNVYDRIGKDAESIQDVLDSASKENRDAVNWWINTWSNDYDTLRDVSLNIYNADLGKDENYTPDSFSKIEDDTEDSEDLGKSAFMLTTKDYTVKKKTGVLMEAKKPSKLSKNRIVSFDFDTNNARAYEAAMVDVNTAESIRVVDGFINSKEFSKLGSVEDARLLKRRINSYIGEIRGKNFVKKSEISSINETLDTIGAIGASMALGGITQPIKQTIPVAINTLINTGGLLDIKDAMTAEANEFINNSGMPVANRGKEAYLNVNTASKYIDEAASSNTQKAIALIKKASSIWLDFFLKNPDVFIARASFLSYYKYKLNKMGYDTNKMDWANHKPVASALQYAQDMLDRQQNVSDAALMGDLMTSKDPAKQVVKKTLFTFMNFVLNQKARMYSDVITLKSSDSTKEDKKQAAKSLAALSAEMATYTIVGGAISESIHYLVSMFMGVDEDEEARRKRMKSRVETVATNMATDFLSPLPVTNGMVITSLNKALDLYYKATDKEGEDEGSERFRFFEKDKQGLFDNLGAAGIAATKYGEMFEMFSTAFTGEFTQEYAGKEKSKFLRDKDQDAMKVLSFVNLGYNLGLLPSEAGSIVRSATRVAKKRALSEEDNDTRAQYRKFQKQLPDYLK